jgi:hypothetical protein
VYGSGDGYIEPGSLWENGYRKSFGSKLQDEFLNSEISYSMKEIRVPAERWRVTTTPFGPHSSLGYRPPAPAARVRKNLGYGEVETAMRFPLLRTADCDEITNKLAALHNNQIGSKDRAGQVRERPKNLRGSTLQPYRPSTHRAKSDRHSRR